MTIERASDNPFPSVLMVEGDPEALATDAASGQRRLAVGTDHLLYLVSDLGVKTAVGDAAAHVADTSAAHAASSIAFTPDGSIAATTVQAAIVEVRDEAAAGAGAVATDAIWDAAGDLAVGSGANTAAKLVKGNAGGVLAMGNSALIWNSDTSFPASKATGDRYWRSDLGMEFYWDGTRWVSTTLFPLHFGEGSQILPSSTSGAIVGNAPIPYLAGGTDMWLVAASFSTYPGATNDGTKYWTLNVNKRAANDTATVVATRNTSADTASNWTTAVVTIGALLGGAATYRGLDISATKTSTPSSLYYAASLHYRIVAT